MKNYEINAVGNVNVVIGDVMELTVNAESCVVDDSSDRKIFCIVSRNCSEVIIPRNMCIGNLSFKLGKDDCISFHADGVDFPVVDNLSVVTQDGMVEFHGDSFFSDLNIETRCGNGACDIQAKNDCKIFYHSINGFWSSIITGAKDIIHSLGGYSVRNNMPIAHPFGATAKVSLLVATSGNVVCS